ncbi:T9SS type A sorting domain-containing protein, partial [Candidatus Saccharibacteria bacterium]|nr:T9SS type A sorting domain-containing protein [Candidatus Saccharibacteria bacterium]NIV71810.1 T9SS type A sorting domain-containing protein [Calditrichia bacterium]NIW78780.1 T9SS type A sorting domain-containing protein [Calditrichia bacterium]
LKIFDIQGRLIRTLVNKTLSAGQHEVSWDGRNDNGVKLSSGVYFYRIQAGRFKKVRLSATGRQDDANTMRANL